MFGRIFFWCDCIEEERVIFGIIKDWFLLLRVLWYVLIWLIIYEYEGNLINLLLIDNVIELLFSVMSNVWLWLECNLMIVMYNMGVYMFWLYY